LDGESSVHSAVALSRDAKKDAESEPARQHEAAAVAEERKRNTSKLVHGKRDMTPDTALRLERLLGVEAQVWLHLQLAWDLYHATHSKAAEQIQQIKPLKRAK